MALKNETMTAGNNGTTRGLLTGGAIALAAFWLAPGARLPQASSVQVPDAGAQRQQIVEELRTLNRRVAEIAEMLKEARDAGAHTDNKSSPPPRGARPSP